MADVTVIMRTKNSASYLPQTLKALFSQKGITFNLLCMDSGSEDNTIELLKQFPCTIVYGKKEEYLPGAVLNDAMNEVRTKIAVFLNSDAPLLTQSSLQSLIDPLKDDEVAASFGRQICRPNAHLWVQRDYEAAFPDCENSPSYLPFSLAIAAMKTAAHQTIPFYTKAWGSEDKEWATRAQKEGFKLSYAKECLVMHSHNYSLKELWGRRFIEGEAEPFIENSFRYTFFTFLKDFCKSMIRDAFFYGKNGAFFPFFKLILVRWVYYFSFYRGVKFGEQRIKENNFDPSYGQKTVLKHHK